MPFVFNDLPRHLLCIVTLTDLRHNTCVQLHLQALKIGQLDMCLGNVPVQKHPMPSQLTVSSGQQPLIMTHSVNKLRTTAYKSAALWTLTHCQSTMARRATPLKPSGWSSSSDSNHYDKLAKRTAVAQPAQALVLAHCGSRVMQHQEDHSLVPSSEDKQTLPPSMLLVQCLSLAQRLQYRRSDKALVICHSSSNPAYQ